MDIEVFLFNDIAVYNYRVTRTIIIAVVKSQRPIGVDFFL